MEAMFSRRFKLWALGSGCGIIALAGSVALSPAFAGKDAGGNAVGDTTCNSSNPCLKRTNTGSGVAIEGAGTTGDGILAKSASNTGMVGQTTAFSTSFGYSGVMGVDLATPNPSGTPYNNAGVTGKSTTGVGVYATSNSGTAVVGNASGGDGVFGSTQSNIVGLSSAGVFGDDLSNTSLASGVEGFSAYGIGVQGNNFEKGKYLNAAFLGLTFSSSINTYFPAAPPGGLFNSDVGEGVVAESAGSSAETLGVSNFGGGPIMRAYAAKTEVMDIDNGGNMILKGGLTQHGNPHVVTHTIGAGDVVMYAPAQTVASVEDVGEAHLVRGQAYVQLDARFAATMDKTRSYLVFITPQGDTAGLYVTQKSPAGFAVREHGGQSSVAFDYRIVAQPLEWQGGRLPAAPRLSAHGFTGSFTRRTSDLIPNKGLLVVHHR